MAKKFFKVDARAMLTLGRESIKDHTTAVLELVKNSYDAGASVAEVTIQTKDDPERGPYLRIADDGHGMSENDVEDYWLRIGFSVKRTETTTEQGRRRRVGEKGIGRISADRLGGLLELRSQRLKFDSVGLSVNWNDFDSPGRDLDKVGVDMLDAPTFVVPEASVLNEKTGAFNTPHGLPNSRTRSGTELTIRGLRQEWTKADVQELRRELATLTSPFESVGGFQTRLQSDLDPTADVIVTSPFNSIAEIDADFKCQPGKRIIVTIVDRDLKGARRKPKKESIEWNNFVHAVAAESTPNASHNTASNSPQFGPIEVRLLFFPRASSTVRGTEYTFGDLKEFLAVNEGIKIYRDNIRVFPYGDPKKPDGDWLALADRKAQNPAGAGRTDYRMNANQLVGAVLLSRDCNPELVDTSGREGLVEGDAFHQLRQFLLGCVFHLETHYHELFKQRKEEQPPPPNPREQVLELKDELRELSSNLKDVEIELPRSAGRKLEKLREQLDDTQKRLVESSKSLEELASQTTIFRSLATLGIAAATFGHETSSSIDAFLLHAQTARNLLKADPSRTEEVLAQVIEAIKTAEHVSSWGQFALKRLNRDKRRRSSVDVQDLIVKLIEEMRPLLEKSEVQLSTSIRAVSGKAFGMDVECVVVNLMTNAYFFAKTKTKNRHIRVQLQAKAYESVNGFEIAVSDSGPGVPTQRREKIWEPLFTTKVDARGRATGTGLGLSIVQSIVNDLGGRREVLDDRDLGGARFVIWLPLG